ncbi:MAG: hypothetical protein ACM34G_04075 [Acidobacteriota bacterium]
MPPSFSLLRPPCGWARAGRLEEPGQVDQSDSDAYFPQDREAGSVLLCTGKPRSSLRIRTHQRQKMRAYRRSLGLPAPYS